MAVYFIRNPSTGSVKIGWSEDPQSRLRALQTANETELVLEGVLPVTESTERSLHARWADIHIRGEWFARDDDLDDFIRAVEVVSAVNKADPDGGIFTLARFSMWVVRDDEICPSTRHLSANSRELWMRTWVRQIGGRQIEPEIFPLPSRKHINQVVRYFASAHL